MSGQIGQQIGHYRLVQLLGQGSFGGVYLAEHLHLQTQAAIKILHHQVDADEREAFIQEARTIASLKHAHILRVLDFGFDQGMPYLVTEYAPNGTLRQKHPRGSQVPVFSILAYIQQIAQALQYAHDRQLIHRDVKPENVLFDEHGQVVLSDFGIALQGSRKLTSKDIAGTATYMAPEVFQGKPRRASDQYALGIMVYEWLTGNPPFQGDFYGLVGQHVSSPVPPLNMMPSEVAQVVYKSLEKVPEHRFPTVTAFADALEQTIKSPQANVVPKTFELPQNRAKERIPMVQSTVMQPPKSTMMPPPVIAPVNAVKRAPLPVSPLANRAKSAPQLPKYGFLYAFIIGLITGPLSFAILFHMPLFLVLILGGIICCLAGFVTGKTAVDRKMGWITGIVTGISFGITGSLYNPASVPELNILYTFMVPLFTLPFTFGGIWLATRTHPYYRRAG